MRQVHFCSGFLSEYDNQEVFRFDILHHLLSMKALTDVPL